MEYSKFKDAEPKATIQKAKDTLQELGVEICFSLKNPVEGVYSSRMEDRKHGWGVNGKGTTEEYCLASGFGEAMERFQCNYAYPWRMASEEAQTHLGFRRAPDEVIKPIADIEKESPDVWKIMQDMWGNENREEMLETWEEMLNGDAVSFVPYYSCKKRETVLLPDLVVSFLDGSNGLCAGNTPQEALCQGFSEVIERYAQKEILLHKLTPPQISEDFLQTDYPTLYVLIKRIEKASGYRILVKDASLGKGFPVVSVAIVDIKKQRYHLKFGAHPTFAVALERCLTELLQGYTPGVKEEDAFYLTPWEAQPQMPYDSVRNLYKQFRDGTGSVPDEYFAGKPSWEFVPWGEAGEFTNSKGMHYMCDKLCEIAGDVYIRDMGYLGFPTYRIFVPGVSENSTKIDKNRQKNTKMACFISNLSSENCTITKEQARLLADFIASNDTDKNENLEAGGNVPLILLRAALLYDAGDFSGAAEQLRGINSQSKQYCCAAMELELQNKGYDEAFRDEMLDLFFDFVSVSYAAKHWRSKSAVQSIYSTLSKRAQYREARTAEKQASQDRVDAISALHKKVKQKMIDGMRDQSKIKELF